MSLFFLLNNLHFALEILGALAFLVAAWLALDSFLVRRNFKGASRGIGFAMLAVWQIIHAFNFSSDFVIFLGYALFIFGILFVLINLLAESLIARPEFKAVLILPSLAAALNPLNIAVTAGLFLITILAFRQYKRETKKALMPFWVAFLFLSLGSLSAIFYDQDSFSGLWVIGHGLELIGFFALGWWVWKYLELRIREELLLVFISLTLFMAVIVTLTFSSILITRMEDQTREGLLTNARVLDFTISGLEEEALAKTKLFARDPELAQALALDDFIKIEELASDFMDKENLGFLTVLDQEGFVILRAHALSKKEDNLSKERASGSALAGEPFVTIETTSAEKFSIRAASPIADRGEILGVVIGGFSLDNALADNMKRITGLDMSIFEGNTMVAATYLHPDGRTRSIGVKQTDPEVLKGVLELGTGTTLRTKIFSRPYLASFLPIRDADNNIVGMLSAAKAQNEILETAEQSNRLTLGAVVIIMIIMVMPVYLITKRLSKEVS